MAKKTTLNELGDMLEFAVNRMATKDDIRGIVREEIMPFRTELKGEIAALGEQATNVERELRVIRRDLGDPHPEGRKRHRLPQRDRPRA
jgi:hypothetical protein